MAKLDPKKIARNGWFAARLRRLMKEQGLRNKDLADRMQKAGLKGSHVSAQTNVSTWVRAVGFPGNLYRTALAKALGVAEEELYAKPEAGQELVPVKPGRALVPVPTNGHENTFNVVAKQGLAELRLHVAIPVAQLDRVIFGLRQLGILE
jgi:transcriptional regulator with XRE-family HTH domain